MNNKWLQKRALKNKYKNLVYTLTISHVSLANSLGCECQAAYNNDVFTFKIGSGTANAAAMMLEQIDMNVSNIIDYNIEVCEFIGRGPNNEFLTTFLASNSCSRATLLSIEKGYDLAGNCNEVLLEIEHFVDEFSNLFNPMEDYYPKEII